MNNLFYFLLKCCIFSRQYGEISVKLYKPMHFIRKTKVICKKKKSRYNGVNEWICFFFLQYPWIYEYRSGKRDVCTFEQIKLYVSVSFIIECLTWSLAHGQVGGYLLIFPGDVFRPCVYTLVLQHTGAKAIHLKHQYYIT